MKKLPVKNSPPCMVDNDVWEWASEFKWHLTAGYPARSINKPGLRAEIYLHIEVMGCVKGRYVDHVNHNSLDARRQNLRICTTSQNLLNRRKSAAASRYFGVYFYADRLKRGLPPFMAQAPSPCRPRHIGYFHNKVEAARARDKVAKSYSNFCSLNLK